MKIQKDIISVIITDLGIQGIDSITVNADKQPAASLFGNGVGDIDLRTTEEVRALRDALTETLTLLGAETANLTGPWARIEDVPTNVKSVRDKDGDVWHRKPDDGPDHFGHKRHDYLNHYAPFKPLS